MTRAYWPQILIALFLFGVTVGSIVRDGKPISNPTINWKQTFWACLWLALILGMGGFWELH